MIARLASLTIAPFALVLAFAALEVLATQSGHRGVLLTSALADDDDDDDDDDDGPGFRMQMPRPSYGRSYRRSYRRSAPRPRATRPSRRATPVQSRGGSELVIAGIDAAALQRLRDARFDVIAERPLTQRTGVIARVRPPRNLSPARAIARVREIAPGALVDRNDLHGQVYRVQSLRRGRDGAFADPFAAVVWPAARTGCKPARRIGMIDTGVDPSHPALEGRKIARETIRGPNLQASSNEHGTAIATLLIGAGRTQGLVPAADIVAIDAFHRRGRTDVADTFDLVSAIDRLVAQQVGVINLSLAGPANDVLDAAGRAAFQKGVLVVAAAGNNGPASAPLFPAGYDWSVAVTAMDKARRPYARAVRGSHIDLAAPGVGLLLDDERGNPRLHSGTSFAAPFVTAALALGAGAQTDAAPASIANLTKAAVDLGSPGRDDVFGWGLLQLVAPCGR